MSFAVGGRPGLRLEFVCVFGQDGLLELATEWFSNDYWPLYATYGHQNTPRIRRDCASLILVDDSLWQVTLALLHECW